MKHLLQELELSHVHLNNRLVMPPIATYQATEGGRVTDRMLDYYGERAKSGHIGMIITEHSYICKQGKAKARQLSISEDADIDGLRKLTAVIHQSGTKAMAQLNHAGSAALREVTGMPPVAPSGVVLPVSPAIGDGEAPEAMTQTQIEDVVRYFAKAAFRAKEAGYDGVEIHSAHAYLLNEFYSPLTNKRTDAYGGSLDNRLRIHKEVIAAVRAAVGDAYLISLRLGGCDYADGGSTVADSVYAAKVFEEAGVNMLNISGGMCRYTRPGHTEPGYFREISTAVRSAVNIPVMLTGGVTTAQEADLLLEQNAADLIGVGRALLKNPHWAEEAFAGLG